MKQAYLRVSIRGKEGLLLLAKSRLARDLAELLVKGSKAEKDFLQRIEAAIIIKDECDK